MLLTVSCLSTAPILVTLTYKAIKCLALYRINTYQKRQNHFIAFVSERSSCLKLFDWLSSLSTFEPLSPLRLIDASVFIVQYRIIAMRFHCAKKPRKTMFKKSSLHLVKMLQFFFYFASAWKYQIYYCQVLHTYQINLSPLCHILCDQMLSFANFWLFTTTTSCPIA